MRLRLSAFWFFYLAGLGVFLPFYTLYLRENVHLQGIELGLVQSMLPLVGVVAQPFWGQVADRSGARTRVLALLTTVAGVAFAALALGHGFAQLLLLTALLAIVSTGILPLAVSVSMAALGSAASRTFGYVRVWGTISFLCSVIIFPRWLEWRQAAVPAGSIPSQPSLALMFPVTAALTLLAAVTAGFLPRGGNVSLRAERGDWRILLRDRALRRLLAFSFGAYLFTQGPMTLFPIYVRALGGDMHTVGQMWIVMLVLEIPLVAASGLGFGRFGARRLLGIGTAACGLRWVVCALTDDVRWVYSAQLLHGVVVAGLMVGGSLYLDLIVPARLRSTAQSLLAMAGAGLGTIASNVAAGWLLDRVGVTAPYLIGGIGALGLGVLAPWALPPSRDEATESSGGA